MSDTRKSDPKPPARRTAPLSEGKYSSGSLFRLVREIRGSSYKKGDQFMLIDEADCHDPHVLKLGGVGETYFIDPRGAPLRIEAGDTQIDSIFELVETPEALVKEATAVPPTPEKNATESQLEILNERVTQALNEIRATDSPKSGEVISVVGPAGPKGERGERGLVGPVGPRGERGEKGERGERGEKGERGLPGFVGPKGESGKTGERGERGEQGLPGLPGIAGPRGKIGERGPRGLRGERGPQGADGKNGERGPEGKAGKNGKNGKNGQRGAKGPKGERGEKGEKGGTGIVTAKFPLVYNEKEQSISIDEARLDAILKKILSGKTPTPVEMGWLASTGGGGKVGILFNGTKITPDVRSIDFTGAGVESVTKVGGKVTVNVTGGGIGNTNFFYQETPPTEGVTVGSRWMDSDNGQEYIYINDGNSNQWVQPSAANTISATINTVVGITGSAYECTNLDYYVGVSCDGVCTITLPDSPEAGREIIVKDEGGKASQWNRRIIVQGFEGDTIDNKDKAVINIDSAGLHFIYRLGWRIV